MTTAITSLPQQITTDLPAFASTSSDTLVTWSNPEEGAMTTQVNPKVHIGDFCNAHINQYVFCLNNPVNYRDPSGLCSEGSNEGLIGAAGVLEQAGQVRYNYNYFVSQLRATGAYSSQRDALREFFNRPGSSTALSRGVADMYRWEQGLNGAGRSMANPTATAPAVNSAAAMARWGGRSLVGVGAGLSVYDIATAPDPYRATVQNGSAIAVGAGGASAGAWAGAAIGTAIAPGPGTAIGAVVGAIIGGVGGGVGGHALGAAAYDANYGLSSPW